MYWIILIVAGFFMNPALLFIGVYKSVMYKNIFVMAFCFTAFD